MTQQKEVRYEIVNGPGKFNLMLSVFNRNKVVFHLSNGKGISVIVTGVEQEDGSCESWCISGYLDGGRFNGYYRTNKNKGFLIVKEL